MTRQKLDSRFRECCRTQFYKKILNNDENISRRGGFTRPLIRVNKFTPTQNDKTGTCATPTFAGMTDDHLSIYFTMSLFL